MGGNNLVDLLTDEQVAKLATDATTGFDADALTMEAWEDDGKKGMELAQMITTEKSYPLPDAANAKFPLIAQAALQFNARVYPALSPSSSPVHVKVWGQDKDGMKQKRADRVSEYMQFQLSISKWEEDIDRLTIKLPIVGTVFRKVFYDPIRGLVARNCGRVVLNNECPNIIDMPRISEEFALDPDGIVERIRSNWFVDFDWRAFSDADEYSEQEFIEQHCRHDLDGDGYPEPYILTLHKASQKVVRVVANFDDDDIVFDGEKIIRIAAKDYYVAFTFLPSMDGSFLGVGLGHLLNNTSEIINGVINQILDSAHLASLGGGFLGAGLNLKGGPMRIQPGECIPVPVSGANIRDAMVQLTFPGPSPVLFQMLGLLIDSGKDISSISDVMTGDLQRQQTATTTLALIEQGMMVFTAAYKRLYRALKREFGLMARINAKTVRPEVYNLLLDEEDKESGQIDPKSDFDLADLDIMPVADPQQVTNMQRLAKAQLVMELIPNGIIDPREAHLRILEAAGIEDREALVPEPDPRAQALEQAQARIVAALQQGMAEVGLAKEHAELEKTMSETEENRAQAVESIADATAGRDGMQIDQMLKYLELINQARANEARRSGPMAAAPGNNSGSAQPVTASGAA